ncbi:plasmid pRiA4b ORF-3 family protein [Filobacillus milosensis]|nr:plasmid pRiA4b ORF-3 family protein [Filobacillus milosensis]
MIYQFKMTIKDSKPPVWRRILVDSQSTFAELHDIIQLAFDWENEHLHSFEFREEPVYGSNFYYIENTLEEFQLPFKKTLSPAEEILEDHFIEVKDKSNYSYDFGEDWELEIRLESVLNPDPDALYPQCIKARRDGPGEVHKIWWLKDQAEETEFDHKAIAREVDEALEPLKRPASNSGQEIPNEEWLRLFKLADDFNKLKPWKRLYDDQIIAVYIPELDDYAFCSILGRNGEEFGLVAYIGQVGLKNLYTLLNDQIDSIDEFARSQSAIQLSLSDREELEPEDYEIIKSLGLSYRGKKQWPLFRTYVPGYYPWTLSKESSYILSIALEEVIKVIKRINTMPFELPDSTNGEFFARTLNNSEEYNDAVLKIDWGELLNYEVPLVVKDLDIKGVQKQFQKANISLEFDSFQLNEPVQNKPEERPFYPRMFVAADSSNGMVIFHDMLEPGPFTEQIQYTFLKLVENINAIPNNVVLQQEAYRHLSPLLEQLNIQSNVKETLPNIDELKQGMLNNLPF